MIRPEDTFTTHQDAATASHQFASDCFIALVAVIVVHFVAWLVSFYGTYELKKYEQELKQGMWTVTR